MNRNLIKKARKIPWVRLGKWTTPLFMDAMGSEALVTPYLAPLGYKHIFKNFLVIDGEVFWDEHDVARARRLFERAWRTRGDAILRRFHALNVVETRKTLNKTVHLQRANVGKLGPSEIVTALKNWIRATQPIMHLNTLFVPLDEMVEPTIIETVRKSTAKIGNSAAVLTELTPPRKVAEVIKEEWELLALACSVYKSQALTRRLVSSSPNQTFAFLEKRVPRIAKSLVRHRERYAWLAVTDWLGPLYGLNYYLRRFVDMLQNNPCKALEERKRERQAKEQLVRERLREIQAPPKLQAFIGLVRDLIDLKQAQWDAVSISGYRARALLTEIGKRLGLMYDEVLQLTPREIETLLKEGKRASKQLTRSRLRHRALLRIGSKAWLFDGKDVAKLKGSILKIQSAAVKVLKGSAAFPGVAQGRVRVIPTIREVSAMRQGEILVCPMTNPDFMPAVRKARAIVTDEGGILAHASIISRELKIPCVVGTKVASQVFKNGDLVEVDANRGVVRILIKS